MAKRDECQDWAKFPVLRDNNFGVLAEQYIELKEMIDILETQKKSIADQLQVALVVSEQKGVLYHPEGRDHPFVVDVRQGRAASKIDAKKLVSAGVSADVIAAATVEGAPYQYVMFSDTTPKPPKEGAAPNVS